MLVEQTRRISKGLLVLLACIADVQRRRFVCLLGRSTRSNRISALRILGFFAALGSLVGGGLSPFNIELDSAGLFLVFTLVIAARNKRVPFR